MDGNTQSLKSPALFEIRLNSVKYSLFERINIVKITGIKEKLDTTCK